MGLPRRQCVLEVQPHLRGHGSWGHIVGSTERGQEIIERGSVGHVDGRKLQAPFVFIVVEQIVIADTDIEEVARGDPSWVVVVILGAGGGQGNEPGAVACGTRCERSRERWTLAPAEETGL